MRRHLLTGLLIFVTVSSVFAGDRKWWATRIGGFSFGVGEISNHILIYWGDGHWVTPLPSGHKWLVLYQLTVAAVILTITFLLFRRRKV